MRTPAPQLLGFLLALLPITSCDDLTTGQLPEDPSAPMLMHVLIQDALSSGGRRMATDLLETVAGGPCSQSQPCPSGEAYQHLKCHFADPNAAPDATGTCPNPLRPEETPAPTTSGRLGGTQIRIVFSKLLATDVESFNFDVVAMKNVAVLRDDIAKSLGLYDGDSEVASTKYYDAGGSPDGTSDLLFQPYGPALVVKPKVPLTPLKQYTIHFDPSLIKDKSGQGLGASDKHGAAVQKVYPFTVETVYFIDPQYGGGNVGFNQLTRTPGGQKIKPQQAVVLFANWPFDPASVSAAAHDSKGNVVKVVGTAELGDKPTLCHDNTNPERMNVIPLDANGARSTWTEGNYTLDITATAQDVVGLGFKADNLGKVEFKNIPFVVQIADPKVENYDPVKDPFASQNLLLPTDCPLPAPDGGM